MLLSYSEMLAVSDRHYNGKFYDVVGIRKELAYSWGFDDMQIQSVIWYMKDKGLI